MTAAEDDPEHVAEQVRILCGAYADLLDGLADAKREMEAPGADRLAAVERALGAVVRFVQGDRAAFAAGAHLPLLELAKAVHDVKAGAKPKLFEGRAAHNRPSGDSFALVRGQAAAAVVILEDAGLLPGEASDFVAAEMARAGIVQPGGKPIRTARVLRWRDELHAVDKTSQVMRDAFRAAIRAEMERPARSSDPGTPEALEAAKRRASALIASLAMWFASSGKGAC